MLFELPACVRVNVKGRVAWSDSAGQAGIQFATLIRTRTGIARLAFDPDIRSGGGFRPGLSCSAFRMAKAILVQDRGFRLRLRPQLLG
jgi:hypothetical protein